MINETHYKECYNLLTQLIEKYTAIYTETMKSKCFELHINNVISEDYEEGFDPNRYRESLTVM